MWKTKKRDYYEQLYTEKLDDLEEIDKFLELYCLPRLNQEEIENLSITITSKEIELVIKKIPISISSWPYDFTHEFYQTFKDLLPLLNQGGERPIPWKLCHWWKELKKTQRNGKIFHVLGLEELILLTWYVTQSSIQIQCKPYQNSSDIFHWTMKLFKWNRTNISKTYVASEKILNS